MVSGSGIARVLAIFAAVAVVAGGGADDAWAKRKKKAQVEAPPPPPPIIIPQRPYPPDQAPANVALPALGADGLYYSPNRNITPAQALWNLRSAYNVAALNCPEPQRGEITANYKAFLRAHAKTLTATNRQVDTEYRKKYGARFIAPREQFMTYVYNHFAFPPTLTAFCNASLAMSRNAKAVKSAQLQTFAANELPAIEIVFDDFKRRYAKYRTDLAAWDAQYLALYIQRYGPPPGMVMNQTVAQASVQPSVPAPGVVGVP